MIRVVIAGLLLLLIDAGGVSSQILPTSCSAWIRTGTLDGHSVTALVVSDSLVFAGTDSGGVYVSRDDGASWTRRSSGLENMYVTSLATNRYTVFAGTMQNGVRRSTDFGANWYGLDAGLPENSDISCLVADGLLIYAGVFVPYLGAPGGVFRSTDNGVHWSIADTIWEGKYVLSLAVNKSNVVAGTVDGIFRSTNSGERWTQVALPNSSAVMYVVGYLCPYGNNFIASIGWSSREVIESGGGVFVSKDTGKTWTPGYGFGSIEGGAFSVSSAVSIDNELFASTAISGLAHQPRCGVDISSDTGKTWSPVSEGLVDTIFVTSLAVSHGYLVAGTRIGIYRRAISDILSSVPNSPGNVSETFDLFQNYPNPFNPTSVISYQLTVNSHVTLRVYDVLGREVRTLVNGNENPGRHEVVFNATGLPTGVYFYRINAGTFSSIRKMLLIK